MSIESLPGAEEAQKAPSVYDFVYVDRERIASTLSQFDDLGNLTKMTKSSTRKGMKRGEATIPGVAKGQIERGNDEAQGREYDPSWLAPLNFLDELAVHELLVRDIKMARIGQFVLLSGALSVADLTLLSGMWENPAIRKTMMAQADQTPEVSRQQRRSQVNTKPKANEEAELAVSILGLMPHYLQATIGSGDQAAWFNMEPQYMRQPVGDFTLKHGGFIPGTWHAIGILDARPEDDLVDFDIPPSNVLSSAFSQMALPIRFMMGRPIGVFGITPIIVFRQIDG
jgi:hypothetical protein